MTHFSKAAVALVVVALATAQVRADFVPWSYNWEPDPLIVKADGQTTAHLRLTDEPLKRAKGTSDIIVTNIRAFSDAARFKPNHYSHALVLFTLVLTDLRSHQSAILNFRAFFTGTVSATSANIRLHFLPPKMEEVTLGGHHYTVTLGMFTPPGPPGALNAGSLSAHVTVDGMVQPPQTPAPSSLVLSIVGVAGLGLFGWKRWHAASGRDKGA